MLSLTVAERCKGLSKAMRFDFDGFLANLTIRIE
jgi:hypothetical protein